MENANDKAIIVGCEARMIRSGEWQKCRLAEITPRGALLEVEVAPAVGEEIVACIAEVGAFPATVEQVGEGRCAVAFKQPARASSARMAESYRRPNDLEAH